MESLQEKLLNFYPSFLTRLPDSVQYRFVKTVRNSLFPIFQTLKILSLQEDLDRPIQIWKEQSEPCVYNMHFRVLLDNIECIEIYRENLSGEDDLLEAFHYNLDECKSDFYHVLRNVHTDNDEIIPSTRYYIYVRTYDEFEFYKGFPENDFDSKDYLSINKSVDFDGTYCLEFKTSALENIFNVSIETYRRNSENKYILLDVYNETFNNPKNSFTKTFNKILKEDILENKYVFKVQTYENKINSNIINPKNYILTLNQNKLSDDIFNHDYALDIIGKRLNFPRSNFTPYSGNATNYDLSTDSEYIKFYRDSEPSFNNRYSEDDYHYAERMKFYCENIQPSINDLSIGENVLDFTAHRKTTNIKQALELPQLEIFKYWGFVPEMINRDKYLFKQGEDTMRGLYCGNGDEGIKVPTNINLKKTPKLIIGVESKLTAIVCVNETGEPVNKGYVLFKIKQANNIITQKVKIENYQAILYYTPQAYGNLTIELTYQGTGKYKRCKHIYSDKDALLVNRVPVKFYGNDVRTVKDKAFTLSAHLVSTRNNTEKITGDIYFKIQDIKTTKSYNISYHPEDYYNDYINEVKHLEPQLLVNIIPIGEYTVTAYYSGSDIFESASVNFKLKITEEAQNCYLHSIFIPPNHISCKLFNDDGVALNDKEVSLKYKHVAMDTIKTQSTKYTPFSPYAIIPENPGDLTLNFYGDDEYKATSYKIPIFEPFTLENTIILIPNNINCLKGKNTILYAILYSKQGQVLSNQNLEWYINNKSYQTSTDNNGVATLNLQLDEIGEYSLNIQYKGDNLRYYPSEANSKIKVINALKTSLSVNTHTLYVDGELTVTLTDENNERIPYQEVYLKNTTLTDQNYNTIFAKAKTNSQGQAVIKFNMSPKKDKQVQVVFDGDNDGYYEGTSLDITDFNIKKHPLNINSTPFKNSEIVYSDGMCVKTTVRDGDTLEALSNIPVYWHFTRVNTGANEKIGPILTNNQGIAEHKLGYAPGDYTYGVIIEESSKYNGKDTYTNPEYCIPFKITKNTNPTESIKTFKISSTPSEINPGDTYNVSVILTGESNISPSGKVVIYTGENKNGTLTGIQGEIDLKDQGGYAIGSAQLNSNSNTNPNTYTLKAYYTGDTLFKETDSGEYNNGTSKITVKDTFSTTTKSNITNFTLNILEDSICAGDEYTVNISIKGDKTPTGTVKIYTQNNHTGYQGEGVLDSNGNCKLKLKSNPNANPNTYTLYAYYTGDNNYNIADSKDYTNGTDKIILKTRNTNTESIIKTSPSMSFTSNSNAVTGENYTLIVNLPTNSTGSVSFLQNGVNIETVTVNQGLATLSLNIKQINPNNGNFTVYYSGDNNYTSKTQDLTLRYQSSSKNTIIIPQSDTLKKGEEFKVKLTDTNGNPIIGYRLNISFTLNGQTQSFSPQPTDTNGLTGITINYERPTGTIFTVTYSFTSTNEYNGYNGQTKVKYINE